MFFSVVKYLNISRILRLSCQKLHPCARMDWCMWACQIMTVSFLKSARSIIVVTMGLSNRRIIWLPITGPRLPSFMRGAAWMYCYAKPYPTMIHYGGNWLCRHLAQAGWCIVLQAFSMLEACCLQSVSLIRVDQRVLTAVRLRQWCAPLISTTGVQSNVIPHWMTSRWVPTLKQCLMKTGNRPLVTRTPRAMRPLR